MVLHSPTVVVSSGELSEGMLKQSVQEVPVEVAVVNRNGASVALKQIDLTGVGAVTFTGSAPSQYNAIGGKIELHLDSVDGALLGESELIRPTGQGAPPARLRVPLKSTSGLHDLYLVFRNPDAKTDQFMFALMTATFESGK